jgi:hypothetical protein
MLDSWTFEVGGRTFAARVLPDHDEGAPWENSEGHGDVSEWTTRAKRPGELVLAESWRGQRRYYDFAGAVKRARNEGWNAAPYFPPGEETKGQRARKAALSDFNYLRAWCNDEWHYVGVTVTPVCTCCGSPDPKRAESCWGIESTDDSYLRETAEELAGQFL